MIRFVGNEQAVLLADASLFVKPPLNQQTSLWPSKLRRAFLFLESPQFQETSTPTRGHASGPAIGHRLARRLE